MGSVGGRENLGYNNSAMQRIENVRQRSETSRIAREASREAERGTRNWQPEEGQRIRDVSYERASNELFNAPVGTVITMDKHTSGDYVGEYTRTANGWTGSQRYRSSFRNPSTVSTAEGFAMQIVGNDIKVVKVGRR